MAIPNLLAIVLCPLVGYLLDRVGHTLLWITVSTTLLVISFIMCLGLALNWPGISEIPVAVIMVLVGISYSIFSASIWPLLPFIVQRDMLGTGYGIMISIQNLGLAIVPAIIGAIRTNDYLISVHREFVVCIIVLAALALLTYLFTAILYVVDRRTTGGILNAVGTEKEKYQEVLNGKKAQSVIQ